MCPDRARLFAKFVKFAVSLRGRDPWTDQNGILYGRAELHTFIHSSASARKARFHIPTRARTVCTSVALPTCSKRRPYIALTRYPVLTSAVAVTKEQISAAAAGCYADSFRARQLDAVRMPAAAATDH